MVTEGRRRISRRHENGDHDLRKGPWKEEEDEVLINHVRKYGPRDWSSIRSKGLLQRTGKSCRLRWVNKLRPNLKNGVKFSAEEERTVIELQAQFGNKWARIATYLPGRTDNDVKNFWSSRQKRLARILQTSAPSSSSSSSNKSHKIIITNNAPTDPKEDEPPLIKPPSNFLHEMKTVYPINVLGYENCSQFGMDYNAVSENEKKPLFGEPRSDYLTPFAPVVQNQPEFPMPLESQEFIAGLVEPNFLDVFGQYTGVAAGGQQFPIIDVPFVGKRENIPDVGFMDDFPSIDMFPSPSRW
ncbi:hypothetical protein ABFS83_02G143300 [Erythranthe nasuta]